MHCTVFLADSYKQWPVRSPTSQALGGAKAALSPHRVKRYHRAGGVGTRDRLERPGGYCLKRPVKPMLPSNFGTGGHCFAVAALGYEASEPPRWCSLGYANTDAEVSKKKNLVNNL